MAMNNGRFKATIDEKCINDYLFKDKTLNDSLSIKQLDRELIKRKEKVVRKLNINKQGLSDDLFWQEIWDISCCKSNINTNDALWTDTNVASALEGAGTYLLLPMYKKESKIKAQEREEKKKNNEYNKYEDDGSNYSRPKSEVSISDKTISTEDLVNDKNYRLAPDEDIFKEDYRHRQPFSKDYEYYKNTYYPHTDALLINKIYNDMTNRYGYCEIDVEYTPYELKDFETWSKIRNCESKKIDVLKDAHSNLNILKKQMEKMKKGKTLLFNTYKTRDGEVKYYKAKGKDGIITIPKYEEENRMIKPSVQLRRIGLNNEVVKDIEGQTYTKVQRPTNVNLNHLTSNIGDVKDYMIQAKLAYNNRVFINPNKISPNKNILDYIDYTNAKHINALLRMPLSDSLDPSNDMSILSYDIYKMVRRLSKEGVLDKRDLEIIEGYSFDVSQKELAEELGITQPRICTLFDRIVRNITQAFRDDKEDLFYLNDAKGVYKKCSKCGESKLIQRFDKKGGQGFQSQCKVCRKA